MKKLLLIEDDAGVRDLYNRWIKVLEPTFRGECELDMAIDLEQGIARISGTKYDAIILDLVLPPQTAEETLSWLFENAHWLPPVIAVTGSEELNIRERALQAGAAQFFTKDDAKNFPNGFFKIIYNETRKRAYGTPRTNP